MVFAENESRYKPSAAVINDRDTVRVDMPTHSNVKQVSQEWFRPSEHEESSNISPWIGRLRYNLKEKGKAKMYEEPQMDNYSDASMDEEYGLPTM